MWPETESRTHKSPGPTGVAFGELVELLAVVELLVILTDCKEVKIKSNSRAVVEVLLTLRVSPTPNLFNVRFSPTGFGACGASSRFGRAMRPTFGTTDECTGGKGRYSSF